MAAVVQSRDPRRKVLIRAYMRAGGPKTEVRVREISARGLSVETEHPPPVGSYVEILRPGLAVVGRVVSTERTAFELASREPIDVEAFAGTSSGRSSNASFRGAEPVRGGTAAVEHRANRSRGIASAMEFALIASCGIFAAATIGGAVFRTMASPFSAVEAAIGGTHGER